MRGSVDALDGFSRAHELPVLGVGCLTALADLGSAGDEGGDALRRSVTWKIHPLINFI